MEKGMNVRKVGIIVKKNAPGPQALCREMVAWFAERHIATVIDQVDGDCDMMVILGGDGTLLHIADQASRHDIPVVGVNLGGLGFLTEVAVDEWPEELAEILAGKVAIEERMMYRARLHRGDAVTDWLYALNDIVISRGGTDQLIRLSAWADDEYITTYRADGLVFSTPTGSTAYNLSAGGPIVHPGQRSILITPICPFMLESRPVLLPATVRVLTVLAGPAADAKVIVDGRLTWQMGENDCLEVRAAGKPLRLICSPRKGYFEILRNKLNWGGGGKTPRSPILGTLRKG